MNPDEFSWLEFCQRVIDFVWGALAGMGMLTALILAVWLADYLTGVTK